MSVFTSSSGLPSRDLSELFEHLRAAQSSKKPLLSSRQEALKQLAESDDARGIAEFFGKGEGGRRGESTKGMRCANYRGVEIVEGGVVCGSPAAELRKCGVCLKIFCENCAPRLPFLVSGAQSASLAPPSPPLCRPSCQLFLTDLQSKKLPLLHVSPSSKLLLHVFLKISDLHTTLCGKLSNYEGLLRFLSEQKEDRVATPAFLDPLPQMKESCAQGISALMNCLNEIKAVSPPPGHPDWQLQKNLLAYTRDILESTKATFTISTKLFEEVSVVHRELRLSPPRSSFDPSLSPAFPGAKRGGRGSSRKPGGSSMQ